MGDSKTIGWLFQRYLNDKCTPEEVKILLQYFDAEENEALLKSLIRQQLEANAGEHLPSGEVVEYLLNTTLGNTKKAIASGKKTGQPPIVHIYMRTWFRVAAAVLILLLSATAFFLFHQKEETIVAHKENNIQPGKDIPPGRSNAILTLSNGTTIMLDSAANGTLAQQGNIKVLKINGQISYNKTGSVDVNGKPVYNTITTARGNQYQLILADGSKVWLNAASSIRFPAEFTGNERRVEITGEAYFEVAKDAKKPFRVFISPLPEGAEIEVLGTHFNVNAYSEEPAIKTTLMEGSVKIKKANAVQMLSPGQQARFTSIGIVLEKNVDLSQVVAWKDGFFWFDNTDLRTLMRQVARWYDVDVNFEGQITEDGFTGKISRNVPLSKFLKVLELNDVHVRIEGRKITVMP